MGKIENATNILTREEKKFSEARLRGALKLNKYFSENFLIFFENETGEKLDRYVDLNVLADMIEKFNSLNVFELLREDFHQETGLILRELLTDLLIEETIERVDNTMRKVAVTL